MTAAPLSRQQYVALAGFRHRLRRFLLFSEAAAAAAGLPTQQHQALLVIAGHDGPAPPSVGVLAEQLIIAPHTAAELVARMVASGLVTKTVSATDRRRFDLSLTPKAASVLAALTEVHLRELGTLRAALTLVESRP